MALYLGNTLVGNGIYLGNQNYRDGNLFMSMSAPISTYSVEYLLVGGGGGGGIANESGGGGAGGLISGSTTLTPGVTYNYVVGPGGSGSTAARRYAIAGSGSYAFGLEARGGGANGTGGSGGNGGSGAGGWYSSTTPGTGVAGQGNSGGSAPGLVSPYPVGGGGGASQVGGTAAGSQSGNGGSGSVWLDGVTYAGGGAGGATIQGALRGLGGPGGGGNGGNASNRPGNGTKNLGGGGGTGYNSGTANEPGGHGGDGVFIFRYPGAQRATGGTVTSAGGYTYHTFTTLGSGSFTG